MNRSAQSSSNSASARSNAIALVLLISGLVVLGSQWARSAAPAGGEQGWTDAEKQEFRELQTVLHKSTAKRPVDQNKIFTRMDALDSLRLDRQSSLAARDRWLRIIGLSLIVGGLLMYFKAKVDSDDR